MDYLYSVAIQANSFHYNMVNKTVWQINRGRINEYSLYNGMASFCTGLGTVHTDEPKLGSHFNCILLFPTSQQILLLKVMTTLHILNKLCSNLVTPFNIYGALSLMIVFSKELSTFMLTWQYVQDVVL